MEPGLLEPYDVPNRTVGPDIGREANDHSGTLNQRTGCCNLAALFDVLDAKLGNLLRCGPHQKRPYGMGRLIARPFR